MYEGIVAVLGNIQPIKGKDRIVSAQVFMDRDQTIPIANIVTGIDTPQGTLGIYFGPDIQLSEQFCTEHKLTRAAGGYLDNDKRRITAQRFAGVKSEGLWLPLHTLGGAANLKLAEKITQLNGIEICKRYPKPQAFASASGVKVQDEPKISVDMPENGDTDQLTYNIKEISRIPVGATVIITEKLHGTSHRIGNVKVSFKLNWWQRTWNWVTQKWLGWDGYKSSEYRTLHGTRRVILLDTDTAGFYGSNEFRYRALEGVLPEQDEIIYGELVGYAGQKLIMPEHKVTDLPKARKQFGDTVKYLYGVKEDSGDTLFFVYRITQGPTHRDLPFDEMCKRAAELGLDVVPLLDRYTWDGDTLALLVRAEQFTQPNGEYAVSQLGANQMAEGICVRFDLPDGTSKVYKRKSFAFKVAEGIETIDNGEDAS